MDSNLTLFEASKPQTETKIDLSELTDESRFIRYKFDASFLKLQNIGTM